MANARIATRGIPSNMDEWNYYTDEAKPFHLSGMNFDVDIDNYNNNRGPIKVERAAARFDFRDGSEDGKTDKTLNGVGNFTYAVVTESALATDVTSKLETLVNVQLQKMSLVNRGKYFYAIRRVSKNADGSDPIICGAAYPFNVPGVTGTWVIDARRKEKYDIFKQLTAANPDQNVNYSDLYTNPFFTDQGILNNQKWEFDLCSEVIKGKEDNPDSWNSKKAFQTYHIWKYASANMLAPEEAQINGLTTGVVFRGKMIATPYALDAERDDDTKALAQAINNVNGILQGNDAPILYSFQGNLYCTFERLRAAALNRAIHGWEQVDGEWRPKNGIATSNPLYVAVFGNGGVGEVTFQANILDENGDPTGEKQTITWTDTNEEDKTAPNFLFKEWENKGKKSVESPYFQAFRKAVVEKSKITIYQARQDASTKEWGYFCYYYYWNRHNDNYNNGVMGPMEFAVVRNNVYKLAVTKISRLGHPIISDNDPNLPSGGTPDESEEVYLTVTCEINPWIVRINNIEF